MFSGAQFCRVGGYYILSEINMTPTFVRHQWGTISAHNTKDMNEVRDFGEYLPKTVKKVPDKKAAGKVFVTEGRAEIEDLRTWMQGYGFRVVAEHDAEIVIGSFYYPSWTGRMDGEDIPLFTNDEGLIHLRVPEGTHQINVFFGDTTIRRMAGYASLLSFLVLVAFVLLSCFRSSRRIRSRT